MKLVSKYYTFTDKSVCGVVVLLLCCCCAVVVLLLWCCGGVVVVVVVVVYSLEMLRQMKQFVKRSKRYSRHYNTEDGSEERKEMKLKCYENEVCYQYSALNTHQKRRFAVAVDVLYKDSRTLHNMMISDSIKITI